MKIDVYLQRDLRANMLEMEVNSERIVREKIIGENKREKTNLFSEEI